MRRLSLVLLLVFLAATATYGEPLRLPNILGDHMVLQQQSFARIWGWAGPGQEVNVSTSWNHKTYRTMADPQGNWQLRVFTGEAGGPFSITIEAGDTLVLEDILLGEVWICSGQSNMEWPLSRAETAEEEIPRSGFPEIRLFTVEKTIGIRPMDDVKGTWERCSPVSSADFSAVGYFFGKILHQKLNVPVGLVNTSWGGTPSEAWTSKGMVETFMDFDEELEVLYGTGDGDVAQALAEQGRIEAMVKKQQDFEDMENVGFSEGWMQAAYDDSAWDLMPCPAEWSTIEEVGMLEGVLWMRKMIEIPQNWTGQQLTLELGPVDEMDVTFVNGVEVGTSRKVNDWNIPRVYQIPSSLVHSAELMLSIRIVNTVGQGGVLGHPGQLKIYPSGNADASIPLAGEWKYQIAYRFPKPSMLFTSHTPSVLYNGMIHGLRNMAIKGAIWYQGESNQTRAFQYRTIFPAMIEDWRATWNQGDFPFYFVQIAPYNYGPEQTSPELREAQFLTLSKVGHTGMAVTMDIGNPDDIHPTNKRDVGRRLALWALARDYGRELVFSGPLYREQSIEGNKIRIHFDCTGSGLVEKGGPLSHFEIAGEDRVYHPAQALIDGETVLVSAPEVPSPVAARYGWSNTAEPNLFNSEGLPASSFCTDTWKRITEGNK